LFKFKYDLPIYSPNNPKTINWIPEKNNNTDIKEAHPDATDGSNNFIIITIIILKKLIIVIKKPVIVEILNGTIEKLVKTLNHKETNLNKL
jgi:hypothetical protein